MPRKTPPDISQQVEAILRDATARIVTLMEEQQEAALRPLQQALEALEGTLKGGSGMPEALRTARAVRVRASRPARSSNRPPRDEWVKTADVVERLRETLVDMPDGLRIAELRDLTGYSDMQLHRALRQLRDAREIVKEGELRKTVYRYVNKRKAATVRRKKAAQKPARGGGKPPKAPAKKAPAAKPAPKAGGRAAGKSKGRAARKAKPARPPKSEWVTTDDVKRAIRKALGRKRKGLKMSELCTATGFTDKQLYRAISSLVDDGLVTKSGRQRSMRYVARKGK